MNGREAAAMSGAAMLSVMAGTPSRAAAAPARVLILGGTGFIGPHFITALASRGHGVSMFNRGRDSAREPTGVERLVGDRNGRIDALRGKHWDVVIDNSGYTARQVRLMAELLHGHIRQYIFISSISAYADLATPGIDENHPLARLADPASEVINDETYGGLKAACEGIVEQTYGAQATIIRPTYIAGPGDTSDRLHTGRCVCQRAATCWRPAARQIPSSSSMCVIWPTTCACVSKSA